MPGTDSEVLKTDSEMFCSILQPIFDPIRVRSCRRNLVAEP